MTVSLPSGPKTKCGPNSVSLVCATYISTGLLETLWDGKTDKLGLRAFGLQGSTPGWFGFFF